MFEEFARLFREREERVSDARNEGSRTLLEKWMKESEILELKAFAAMLIGHGHGGSSDGYALQPGPNRG